MSCSDACPIFLLADEQVLDYLHRRAAERSLTVGELIVRAIALDDYLRREHGGELVARVDGVVSRIVLDGQT